MADTSQCLNIPRTRLQYFRAWLEDPNWGAVASVKNSRGYNDELLHGKLTIHELDVVRLVPDFENARYTTTTGEIVDEVCDRLTV